eukprot:171681-Rhodomonas_salina.3
MATPHALWQYRTLHSTPVGGYPLRDRSTAHRTAAKSKTRSHSVSTLRARDAANNVHVPATCAFRPSTVSIPASMAACSTIPFSVPRDP